jgi:hypothetical protein
LTQPTLLRVEGADGYVVEGVSSMSRISRDPTELVGEMLNRSHQYPDGAVLFLGTMFVPTKDRDAAGGGFTHNEGDVVAIRAGKLGTLANRVGRSDRAPEWTLGTRALIESLLRRGLMEAAVRPAVALVDGSRHCLRRRPARCRLAFNRRNGASHGRHHLRRPRQHRQGQGGRVQRLVQ